MATKTKAEKPAQNYMQTFVQCELPKETKEAVKKWDPKFEITMDALDRLVSDGYKLSIAQDTYHDCVGAFLSFPKPGHKHSGLCLTARGPSYLQALKVLVYKHYQVLQEDWGAIVDQKREHDDWG